VYTECQKPARNSQKSSSNVLVCVDDRPYVCLRVCTSACMSTAGATGNDAVKSAEPRAPLAEMEDIEVKTKKDKNKTTEVLQLTADIYRLVDCVLFVSVCRNRSKNRESSRIFLDLKSTGNQFRFLNYVWRSHLSEKKLSKHLLIYIFFVFCIVRAWPTSTRRQFCPNAFINVWVILLAKR